MDVSTTAIGLTPVLSRRAANILDKVVLPGEIELLPARVDGLDGFVVLNVLRPVDCIDLAASEHGGFSRHGQLQGLQRPVIDASRVDGARIFRVAPFRVMVVVCKEVKEAFEKHGVTGARFFPIMST